MTQIKKIFRPIYITTKGAFTVTLIVIALTCIMVWLQGLHVERSVLKNTLLSTSLLSAILFLFMTIGLYRGFKLKDNLGEITDKFEFTSEGLSPDWIPDNPFDISVGDGIEGIVASIIIWIVASVVISILFVFFSTVIWFSILLLLAVLYWIFFRGLRYVFKKSPICQGELYESIKYAGLYTFCSILWLVILLFFFEHQNYSLVALGGLFD